MALTIIPNQPVSFLDTTDPCKCDSNLIYKQLVHITDKTQFQVTLSPCADAEELVGDPNFNTYPGSWLLEPGYTISGGKLCRDDSAGVDCANQLLTGITEPMILQLTVEITSGCGTVILEGADDAFNSGTLEAGTHVLTFFFYNSNAPTLSICLCDDSCVTFVGIKKVEPPIVSLFEEGGTWVKSWHGDDGTENTIDNPNGAFTFDEDSMTFNLHWDLIDPLPEDGCYYLCLIDSCDQGGNIVVNGDFDTSSGWTVVADPGVSFDFNSPVIYSGLDLEDGTIQNSAPTVNGTCYDVAFNINITGPPDPVSPVNARVRFECGAYAGPWRTANGSYSETFTSNGSSMILRFESTGSGVHHIAVANLVVTVCDEDLSCDYASNTFKLGTFECTHLINACNNKNGMGFVFPNSGFSPRIRLYSKYVRATYKAERESFENSSGKKSVKYFKSRKARTLKIDNAPEYVHDFLRTLMGYDHVWIGATEYFIMDEEYEPQYNAVDDEMASSMINIEEKTQLVENTNCGTSENDCEIIPEE